MENRDQHMVISPPSGCTMRSNEVSNPQSSGRAAGPTDGGAEEEEEKNRPVHNLVFFLLLLFVLLENEFIGVCYET